MSFETINETHSQSVQNYYGDVLQSSQDLRTSACCPLEAMPAHIRPYLQRIHSEVQNRFYGCGSPIPHQLEGKTVLDLGCGSGRDVYILSQLVGEKGLVVGVDMTAKQLAVAREYLDYHMDLFGYERTNVILQQGFIEDLAAMGIADNSVDVVVSNCVINLAADKEQVFREIFRVLKPGGELYFSDVFSDRRIPQRLAADPLILGECLGGALYQEDFRRILHGLGCQDSRTVSRSEIQIHDEQIARALGQIRFFSVTVRAFKLDLEDRCENYGQAAKYLGTMDAAPHAFVLDDHHTFPTGMYLPVCGNTARMLSQTRFAEHFEVLGDFHNHYGLFLCHPSEVSAAPGANPCC